MDLSKSGISSYRLVPYGWGNEQWRQQKDKDKIKEKESFHARLKNLSLAVS